MWPVAGLLALLAGCSGGGTSPAMPAPPAAYPDLARVPAKPRLGYTVEQRREIASGLVADRANARYREAELDFATGRATAPPAPPPAAEAPTPQPAAPPAPPPAGDRSLARAYVASSLDAASDEGELSDFMKRIDRKVPDPYGPATVGQLVGLAPAPAPQPEPPKAGEGEDARGLAGFGGFLGGLIGIEDRPPGQP